MAVQRSGTCRACLVPMRRTCTGCVLGVHWAGFPTLPATLWPTLCPFRVLRSVTRSPHWARLFLASCVRRQGVLALISHSTRPAEASTPACEAALVQEDMTQRAATKPGMQQCAVFGQRGEEKCNGTRAKQGSETPTRFASPEPTLVRRATLHVCTLLASSSGCSSRASGPTSARRTHAPTDPLARACSSRSGLLRAGADFTFGLGVASGGKEPLGGSELDFG